ncbi:MAG: hypothetical protein KW806_03005 [Candidatus Yanofskybacteria bacterium]|nr:hypothetical protein [Candidatus Yanofskybacteria bacterium]
MDFKKIHDCMGVPKNSRIEFINEQRGWLLYTPPPSPSHINPEDSTVESNYKRVTKCPYCHVPLPERPS